MSAGGRQALPSRKSYMRGKRHLINIIIALVAIAVVIFYTVCGTSCAYLRGDLLGIPLQYGGIAFMLIVVALSILKRDALILPAVSAALGSEIFLVGFQFRHETFCIYCLIFAGLVALLFIVNFDGKKKLIMAGAILAGFLLFFFFFKGSVLPTFDTAMKSFEGFMENLRVATSIAFSFCA
jgi:hypothetical protein